MRKIGIDVGSSSIGYLVREYENIIYHGVITFESGMVKGTSGYSSPTKDRRENRSKRNLIRSRKQRKIYLLKTLVKYGDYVPLTLQEIERWGDYQKGKTQKFPESKNFQNWLACDFTYQDGKKYKSPYELRIALQEEKLTPHELGRALYHIVQRRGYKDIGDNDKETEKQIKRRDEEGFSKALIEHGTISKALKNQFLNKGKRARNQYPYRHEYEYELFVILEKQGFNISRKDTQEYENDFVQDVWKSIIWQQPLKSQKGNIGKCTLEPSKNRCPISHPLFEIFRAWSFINTIKYYDNEGKKLFLSQKLREELLLKKFLKNDSSFKFETIKNFLNRKLGKETKYNYPISRKTGKYETSVSGMPICKSIVDIFGDDSLKYILEMENCSIQNATSIIESYSIYDIWHALFSFDNEFLEGLSDRFGLEKKIIKRKKKDIEIAPLVLAKEKITQGYSDLSVKAIRKIIPFLKEGFLYSDAVTLAKIPEVLVENWNENKDVILNLLNESGESYNAEKDIYNITNGLIYSHKGLIYPHDFGQDIGYQLMDSDLKDVYSACVNYFGQETWKEQNQNGIIKKVTKLYQDYFNDEKRSFRKKSTRTGIFQELLRDNGFSLKGKLYHHSNHENLYAKNFVKNEEGVYGLPVDEKTGLEILPNTQIDSIKNPMFNKAMNILRKLINELIRRGVIDEDTEVVIEIARELNDNNKRKAIETYQEFRRKKREKFREFLSEFKRQSKPNLNIEESIPIFELWNEQIFETLNNDEGNDVNVSEYILGLKDAAQRYELWLEQKGQCMYTGKMISITKLFSNEIDVEHTIPRSILPDNTMANKTVAFKRYNTDVKGKKIPTQCPNYVNDTIEGSSILSRLSDWEKIRDTYKQKFENHIKPKGNEDDKSKNNRIYFKHLYKMYFDYWKDKIERFTATEVKDSWARRQLVDTQIVSKYAKELLKTKFKKVSVQKGKVTSEFRKIYQFQSEGEIKNRSKHTHHVIDAYVLTLIPVNSTRRDELLKEMYEELETTGKQITRKPFKNFNSQIIVDFIENNTLVHNYEKDNILKQTKKIARKRGRVEFYKDKNGNNQPIIKMGDTIRTDLYAQTYLGKIRNVELTKKNKPIRENDNWKYKKGDNEFSFVERKPIDYVLKKIDAIVDPVLREHIRKLNENKKEIVDFQGNKIRHVRIYVKAGKKVKERINYRSKHEYKNQFYSSAGSIPYALMLQSIVNGRLKRELLPISSYQIAKIFRDEKKFTPDLFLERYHPKVIFDDVKLLKIGMRVLVLQSDDEIEIVSDKQFQKNRLYKITQFFDSGVYLKHHLEARADKDIDQGIKEEKDKLLRKWEKMYGIEEVKEDETIENLADRKAEYLDRKYKFDSVKRPRFQRLLDESDINKVNEIKKELDKFKKQNSMIEIEGKTPLMKISSKSCNFLYEKYDFNFNILGELNLKL